MNRDSLIKFEHPYLRREAGPLPLKHDGTVPSDVVPTMLLPGTVFLDPKSVEKIGRENLEEINQAPQTLDQKMKKELSDSEAIQEMRKWDCSEEEMKKVFFSSDVIEKGLGLTKGSCAQVAIDIAHRTDLEKLRDLYIGPEALEEIKAWGNVDGSGGNVVPFVVTEEKKETKCPCGCSGVQRSPITAYNKTTFKDEYEAVFKQHPLPAIENQTLDDSYHPAFNTAGELNNGASVTYKGE